MRSFIATALIAYAAADGVCTPTNDSTLTNGIKAKYYNTAPTNVVNVKDFNFDDTAVFKFVKE